MQNFEESSDTDIERLDSASYQMGPATTMEKMVFVTMKAM